MCPSDPSVPTGAIDPQGLPDTSETPAPVVSGEPVQVSDGVFVIPDRRVDLVPNIGIVVGETAALVIDTGMGPRNGAHVLQRPGASPVTGRSI
ncbi:hypothetical protein [Streptomyces niveus]|uniref:hypothetical protein n=1 Tax=Streptomyces niveus TaxID=193462 RepID=UPI00386B9B6B